jgi:hypothetical protein
MPVVFEEIDAEIAPERRADAPAAGEDGGGQDPAAMIDALRRELTRVEMRNRRAVAD